MQDNIDSEEFKFFKGDATTSFRGIASYFSIIFGLFIICLICPYNLVLSLIYLLVFLFLFSFMSWQMCYFGVSEKHLIIKNQNFTWYKKIYNIENISGILIYSPSKRADSLFITTKDNITYVYPAGTLRKNDWALLISALHDNGIKVRDDRNH